MTRPAISSRSGARWPRCQNVPIFLGGDHSITIPIFQGQLDRFRDKRLGVLWLDAHPDLCDEFAGSKLSHACVLRRGLEAGLQPENICMVGLRSWEEQEIELIESGGLNVYTAADVAARGVHAVAETSAALLAALRRRAHFARHRLSGSRLRAGYGDSRMLEA